MAGMGMLDRIKKKEIAGFKDFVLNMETTIASKRVQIFMTGVLEDPIFMDWVMKNLKTFSDVLKLSRSDLETVLQMQESMPNVFAKSIAEEKLDLTELIPHLAGRVTEELRYMGELEKSEVAAAQAYILKSVRQLQQAEKIKGFEWKLPSRDLFLSKHCKDGLEKTFFDNGFLASAGEYLKGKRTGPWQHNYDTGKTLAEGEYLGGLKVGNWIFYYANGDKKAQGHYYLDQKHGTWLEWDRKGNMVEINFVEGVVQS